MQCLAFGETERFPGPRSKPRCVETLHTVCLPPLQDEVTDLGRSVRQMHVVVALESPPLCVSHRGHVRPNGREQLTFVVDTYKRVVPHNAVVRCPSIEDLRGDPAKTTIYFKHHIREHNNAVDIALAYGSPADPRKQRGLRKRTDHRRSLRTIYSSATPGAGSTNRFRKMIGTSTRGMNTTNAIPLIARE